MEGEAMQEGQELHASPELKQLVREASLALARLDQARLEELALSCEALNRALAPADPGQRKEWARKARDASADMAVFSRVLDATRANLSVVNRLRELREGRLEYSEQQARGCLGPEASYGNH
jgi:hypothetical protein